MAIVITTLAWPVFFPMHVLNYFSMGPVLSAVKFASITSGASYLASTLSKNLFMKMVLGYGAGAAAYFYSVGSYHEAFNAYHKDPSLPKLSLEECLARGKNVSLEEFLGLLRPC